MLSLFVLFHNVKKSQLLNKQNIFSVLVLELFFLKTVLTNPSKMVAIKCTYEECKNRPPFSTQSNLNRHVNVMHLSEYVCSYQNCSKIFQTRKDFIYHEKTEHRVRCEKCHPSNRRTFKTAKQLVNHDKIEHQEKIKHNVHICFDCNLNFYSKQHYELHIAKKHQSGGSADFVLHNRAMNGDHQDFRKNINSDHAPEILFSDEYFPQIVTFLSDQRANLNHLKFNLVLTIIYESPVIESNEKGEVVEKSIKSSHESLRKGKYNFYFIFK